MSKQRAQRRSQRLASQQQEARAAREAKQARSRQRRQERRATGASRGRGRGRGRVGFAGMRRSRQQRAGITAVAVGGVALLWILAAVRVLDVGLAIALTVLFLVALPAFVVLTLGRRY